MNKLVLAHIVEGIVDVVIERRNQPGAGGAFSSYAVRDPKNNLITFLNFQEGTIPEKGVNGLTNESLLAVVLDRLQSFQSGPHPCAENADAISAVEIALNALKQRTRRRREQGIEGHHVEEGRPVEAPSQPVAEPVAEEPVQANPEAKE